MKPCASIRGESPPHISGMNLELSEGEKAALIRELDRIIEGDPFPFPPASGRSKGFSGNYDPNRCGTVAADQTL
jgi:hypothetical protein